MNNVAVVLVLGGVALGAMVVAVTNTAMPGIALFALRVEVAAAIGMLVAMGKSLA